MPPSWRIASNKKGKGKREKAKGKRQKGKRQKAKGLFGSRIPENGSRQDLEGIYSDIYEHPQAQ
jgi:hypothetical protein